LNPPLIDTSILVDVLRQKLEAESFIRATAGIGLYTHDTVIGELLTGIRNAKELRALDGLLVPFQILHLSEADSELSLELLRCYKLSHNIGYLDCLIAATALRLNFPVATINDKHFRPIPNLQIIRPY
jgi:predicted nucleic acid-binding protein